GPRPSPASGTGSETWSAILPGCPSVTDWEVKGTSRVAIWCGRLAGVPRPATVSAFVAEPEPAMPRPQSARYAPISGLRASLPGGLVQSPETRDPYRTGHYCVVTQRGTCTTLPSLVPPATPLPPCPTLSPPA